MTWMNGSHPEATYVHARHLTGDRGDSKGGVEYFLVSFSGVYLFSGVEMFVSFRECKWDVFFKWMFMRILVGRSSKQCQ